MKIDDVNTVKTFKPLVQNNLPSDSNHHSLNRLYRTALVLPSILHYKNQVERKARASIYAASSSPNCWAAMGLADGWGRPSAWAREMPLHLGIWCSWGQKSWSLDSRSTPPKNHAQCRKRLDRVGVQKVNSRPRNRCLIAEYLQALHHGVHNKHRGCTRPATGVLERRVSKLN